MVAESVWVIYMETEHYLKVLFPHPQVFTEFVIVLFLFYVLVFLAARHVGSLAPMPGIKSEPPALEDNVLTSGPSGKSLKGLFNTSDWTGFYMKADI